MKLLNIFNWVQSLVESFTFYGGSSSGGGGAMGGGRRFNPMQQNQPFNQRFGGNPNMRQGQPIPGMYPGMGYPSPQVSPPQGGFPQQAQGMPPMPQGMPPNQGQPEGRPFNPQALQNNPYLINNKIPPNFTS